MYKIRDGRGKTALLKVTVDGKIVVVKKKRARPIKRNAHKKGKVS